MLIFEGSVPRALRGWCDIDADLNTGFDWVPCTVVSETYALLAGRLQDENCGLSAWALGKWAHLGRSELSYKRQSITASVLTVRCWLWVLVKLFLILNSAVLLWFTRIHTRGSIKPNISVGKRGAFYGVLSLWCVIERKRITYHLAWEQWGLPLGPVVSIVCRERCIRINYCKRVQHKKTARKLVLQFYVKFKYSRD